MKEHMDKKERGRKENRRWATWSLPFSLKVEGWMGKRTKRSRKSDIPVDGLMKRRNEGIGYHDHSRGGSGLGWDCVSIVRITDLPLEHVSEENHDRVV
jgi:hypothetical protein